MGIQTYDLFFVIGKNDFYRVLGIKMPDQFFR